MSYQQLQAAAAQLQAALAAFAASQQAIPRIRNVGAGELAVPQAMPPLSVQIAPTKYTKSQVFTVTAQTVSLATGSAPSKTNQFFTSVTPNRIATLITPSGNTGNFWVGDATVNKTQHGTEMPPGDAIDYTIDDLSKLWYVADTVGDSLTINWEWGYGTVF